MIRTILACALLCALAACATPFKGDAVTLKLAVGGANISPSTGVTLGGGQTEGHFVPVVAPDGKTPILTKSDCGTDEPLTTYSLLNGNATASATGTNGSSPQAAVAANSVSATGRAARYLGLGAGTAPTPDAIRESQDCSHSIPQQAQQSQ